MVQSDAVLEVSDGVSISAWRRWSASSSSLPLPVGDAAVIAVGGKEGQLGTGRGLQR